MTDGVDMALAKLDEQRKQGEAAQELGEKPKRKRGGQTIYTDEIAEEICRRLETGEGLATICKTTGFPQESTVRGWVKDDVNGFSAKYERARELGLDAVVDAIIALADDETIPPESRRIRVDTRKWYAGKIAPKRYGDRIQHEHSGALIAGTIVIGAATAPKVIEGRIADPDMLPKSGIDDDAAS